MSENGFDAAQYKQGQQQGWDSVAAGWEKWEPEMEEIARHVSEQLIAMAEIGAGHRVLDIATGLGEPALRIAKHVGDTGRVVATDQSPQMIALAKRRAARENIQNVDFQTTDAEQLNLPQNEFDAAVCRWGLMFLPDVAQALRRIRKSLVPGTKFATAVWDMPERIPFYHLAMASLKAMIDVPTPPPGAPTIFGLAEGVLEIHMEKAGFKNIQTAPVTVDFAFTSGADYAQMMKDLAAPISAALKNESPKKQSEYWRKLGADCTTQFETKDGGVRLPSVSICVVGER